MISNYLLCLFGILTCLFADTDAREAIIGGHVAALNQFAYQVTVRIHGYGDVCGGGIIDERYVLTAAHCLLNRDRRLRNIHIFVIAGTINLNETGPPAVSIRVKKVFFPSEFHPTVQFNTGDIAVLKLSHSLQLEHNVHLKKLALPRVANPMTVAEVTGFGWDRYNDNGYGGTDGRLRYATAEFFSSEQCEEHYQPGAIHPDVHLCAYMDQPPPYSGERYGVCVGDGGNPLTYGQRTIFGILSRIPSRCDEREHPAVYTRVSHYLRMIYSVMQRGSDSEMIELSTY